MRGARWVKRLPAFLPRVASLHFASRFTKLFFAPWRLLGRPRHDEALTFLRAAWRL
jgi:hypothetical protein